MSKAEKTKEFIIEKAAPVFNTKGYAGTSLSDLVEATGLTKGSIYGNFKNKDEIAVAVYKYNVKMARKRLDDACMGRKNAADTLIAITEYYRINWQAVFNRGGCPYLNASIEADDNLPILKKHVQSSIKEWAQRLGKFIDQGISNGEFKKNTDTNHYAYLMIAMIEGSMMLAKIENDPKHIFTGMDRIVKMINEELKK
jgi:AcrR family transcriptional regulator